MTFLDDRKRTFRFSEPWTCACFLSVMSRCLIIENLVNFVQNVQNPVSWHVATGIGMYTESTLTVEDNAVISIYDLAAGAALTEVDTNALPHPYNPAVAKPVHLLATVVSTFSNGQNATFSSQIVGDTNFTTPTVWGLYGRDGVNTSDWTVVFVEDMDNESMSILAMEHDTELAVQTNVIKRKSIALQWNVDMMLFAVGIMVVITILARRCWTGKRLKMSSSEYDPLLG